MVENFAQSTSFSRSQSANQLFDLWLLPLEFWSNWWSTCLSIHSSHHLTREELEDKKHAQLVVPEPLKSSDDRELFA